MKSRSAASRERDGHRSLDAILERRNERDRAIGIRCSRKQAIFGSSGVRINDKSGPVCQIHLARAAKTGGEGSELINAEPMGDTPVINELIVDMDAVHRGTFHSVYGRATATRRSDGI